MSGRSILARIGTMLACALFGLSLLLIFFGAVLAWIEFIHIIVAGAKP